MAYSGRRVKLEQSESKVMGNYIVKVKEGKSRKAATLKLEYIPAANLKAAIFKLLDARNAGMGLQGTFEVFETKTRKRVEKGRYHFDGLLFTRRGRGGMRFADGKLVSSLEDLV